jgi:hypothetical protein
LLVFATNHADRLLEEYTLYILRSFYVMHAKYTQNVSVKILEVKKILFHVQNWRALGSLNAPVLRTTEEGTVHKGAIVM